MFNGFSEADFETFHIEGLGPRMEAIRDRIQPKFRELGGIVTERLSALAGQEMFLHVAKHARRKTNPPKDTWFAVSNNKRGYKQVPHFQFGLFDDHAFLWMALIYELPGKSEMAMRMLEEAERVREMIPDDYLLSFDHMEKKAERIGDLSDAEFRERLIRFRDVKKAEFLAGRHIGAGDPLIREGDALIRFAEETYETLMPLYRLACFA